MLVECGTGTQALSIYDLYKRATAYSGGLGETQPGTFDITVTCFDETTHKPSFRMHRVCWLKDMSSSIAQPGFESSSTFVICVIKDKSYFIFLSFSCLLFNGG